LPSNKKYFSDAARAGRIPAKPKAFALFLGAHQRRRRHFSDVELTRTHKSPHTAPTYRSLIEGFISGSISIVAEFAVLVQGEFDVAEMSTATLMRAKEKGKGFLALPVFFQRGRVREIFFIVKAS